MTSFFIIIMLPVIIISCTHEQFQSYLLDTAVEENRQFDRSAESTAEPGAESTAASAYNDELISFRRVYYTPPSTMDILNKRNIDVLYTARKDLESYYETAKYLRKYNKLDDLKLFEALTREYIGEGVDSLLKREMHNDNHEVMKILFELRYLESLLFYEFNDFVMACDILNNLDIQYARKRNLDVDFAVSRLNAGMPHMVLTEFKHMCSSHIISNMPNQKQTGDSEYE